MARSEPGGREHLDWPGRPARGERPAAPAAPPAGAARERLVALTRRAAARWRYAEAGKRDLRLDLLRGFAVFAMAVDHIAGASWLYAVTGGNRFFVSAAEAFVFISGVTVGIVYGTVARAQGWGAVAARLLRRSWTLYALAIWLAVGTALVGALLGDPSAAPFLRDPARFIFEVVTLQRTFYLVDVLLLYLFAMVAAIGAFGWLLRGRWWAVLAASWALWGAYQYNPAAAQLPWAILDNPVFHFASWQVLFFTALVLGYERERIGAWFAARRPTAWLRAGIPVLLGAAFAALVWLSATNAAAFDRFAPRGDAAAVLDAWFMKSALPLPRLLACALVFGFGWVLATRLWGPLRAVLGPFLLVLGQGALYAYAAHLFLAAIVRALVIAIRGEGATGGFPVPDAGTNAALQVGAVALLWALTRAQFLQGLFSTLGRTPLISLPHYAGWRRWRPTETLLLPVLVAALASLTIFPHGVAPGPGRAAPAGQTGAPSLSTVTVPRSVAGRVGPPATPAAGVGATPVAQSGGQLRDGSFFSTTLGRTMGYGIYLPPGYDEGAMRYPTLYMLHGRAGHYGEWVAYGLPETAERLIRAGVIPPLIIVLPQGDESYWSNHVNGDRWGDYLIDDVLPHVDTTYRTIARREGRAIGGLSMGGFGALSLGFTNPERFAAIGAHSPTLRVFDESPEFLRDPELYAQIDPIELAAMLDPARTPRLWIDVGTVDDWLERTALLREQLRKRGLRPEYLESPGGHEADYWRQNGGRYLRFYGGVLAAPVQP